MKHLFFMAAAACAAAVLQARPDVEKQTTPEIFTAASGKTLLYRQYLPPAGKGAKIPLILFFHGAGERGADNAAQLRHGIGEMIRYGLEKKRPFALIAPQCPANQKWVDTPWNLLAHRMSPAPSESMALVLELLKKKIASLPVDQDRVYVTGPSMGGYGTWDIIQREPGIFAAAIPVCGGGDPALAWKFRALPVWAFHGDRDGAVPVERSRAMVAAAWACGGNIRYREYPGLGHNVWTATYGDPAVLDWLFRQTRKTAEPGR